MAGTRRERRTQQRSRLPRNMIGRSIVSSSVPCARTRPANISAAARKASDKAGARWPHWIMGIRLAGNCRLAARLSSSGRPFSTSVGCAATSAGEVGVAQPRGGQPQGVGERRVLFQQQAHQPRKLRQMTPAQQRPDHRQAIEHRPHPACRGRQPEHERNRRKNADKTRQEPRQRPKSVERQDCHHRQVSSKILEYLRKFIDDVDARQRRQRGHHQQEDEGVRQGERHAAAQFGLAVLQIDVFFEDFRQPPAADAGRRSARGGVREDFALAIPGRRGVRRRRRGGRPDGGGRAAAAGRATRRPAPAIRPPRAAPPSPIRPRARQTPSPPRARAFAASRIQASAVASKNLYFANARSMTE